MADGCNYSNYREQDCKTRFYETLTLDGFLKSSFVRSAQLFISFGREKSRRVDADGLAGYIHKLNLDQVVDERRGFEEKML